MIGRAAAARTHTHTQNWSAAGRKAGGACDRDEARQAEKMANDCCGPVGFDEGMWEKASVYRECGMQSNRQMAKTFWRGFGCRQWGGEGDDKWRGGLPRQNGPSGWRPTL